MLHSCLHASSRTHSLTNSLLYSMCIRKSHLPYIIQYPLHCHHLNRLTLQYKFINPLGKERNPFLCGIIPKPAMDSPMGWPVINKKTMNTWTQLKRSPLGAFRFVPPVGILNNLRSVLYSFRFESDGTEAPDRI